MRNLALIETLRGKETHEEFQFLQGNTPWVAATCADCPGFSGPGCCSCPVSTLVSASDCSPGLAFCFTGPWTLLGSAVHSSPTTRAKTGRTAHVFTAQGGTRRFLKPRPPPPKVFMFGFVLYFEGRIEISGPRDSCSSSGASEAYDHRLKEKDFIEDPGKPLLRFNTIQSALSLRWQDKISPNRAIPGWECPGCKEGLLTYFFKDTSSLKWLVDFVVWIFWWIFSWIFSGHFPRKTSRKEIPPKNPPENSRFSRDPFDQNPLRDISALTWFLTLFDSFRACCSPDPRRPHWDSLGVKGYGIACLRALNFQISEPEIWRRSLFLGILFATPTPHIQGKNMNKDMTPKLPNLPCFEAFGVIFWPDVCSYFCLVCGGRGSLAYFWLSAKIQGFSWKFRPLRNLFRTLENGHSIRHQSIPH